MKRKVKDDIVTEVIRVPSDHPAMRRRDSDVMWFLRAQASDTDLGCIKIRVPAVDQLWQRAFELGVEVGASLAYAAAKKQ